MKHGFQGIKVDWLVVVGINIGSYPGHQIRHGCSIGGDGGRGILQDHLQQAHHLSTAVKSQGIFVVDDTVKQLPEGGRILNMQKWRGVGKHIFPDQLFVFLGQLIKILKAYINLGAQSIVAQIEMNMGLLQNGFGDMKAVRDSGT